MTSVPEYYSFTQQILDKLFQCDDFTIELSDVQDIALSTNVIKEVTANEPCGEICQCAEFGEEFPTKCHRRNFNHE